MQKQKLGKRPRQKGFKRGNSITIFLTGSFWVHLLKIIFLKYYFFFKTRFFNKIIKYH